MNAVQIRFIQGNQKGECMATAKQIQYRIGQTKKKLAKLNKDLVAAKGKMKNLEAQLKKAKSLEKPKGRKASPRKRGAARKK